MSARRCPACGYTDPHPVVTHQECRKRAREAALQRALDDGRPLDRKCPSCGRLDVEYNGNYCCRSCDWGLPEDGDVQPWLRSLIRLRRSMGKDTAWEEQYLDSPMPGRRGGNR
jgi:hypothetical protein